MKDFYDQLPHITARIEVTTASGAQSAGTGFYVEEKIGNAKWVILATNRHVLQDAKTVVIHITVADGVTGRAKFGSHDRITIEDADECILFHPDPQIDLAALPVSFAMIAMKEQHGRTPYFKAFGRDLFPNDHDERAVSAVEDVLMVGYPTALWDPINNVPFVRSGVTASPYFLNYAGKSEFVIDAACFPGSSGSPVISKNPIEGHDDNGNRYGRHPMVLGVLYAGPQFEVVGHVSTSSGLIENASFSSIPMNIGYCVKGKHVIDLLDLSLATQAPPLPNAS